MHYDPIKQFLGRFFNSHPLLRIIFYKLLDLLLLRSWHIRRELRRYRREKGPRARVLDAGSGFGQYTYYMARLSKNWEITGIDVKQDEVEGCRRFFARRGMTPRVGFRVEDLTALGEKEKYDLILCVDVMEHIEEDARVFENFCRALRNGGGLLISTPSDRGGSDVHDQGGESFIGEHVRDGYNMEEIRNKLHRAGFRKTGARYSYGPAGSVSWKLSMKYPILMLNASKWLIALLPLYYPVVFPLCILLNLTDIYGNQKTGTGLVVRAGK